MTRDELREMARDWFEHHYGDPPTDDSEDVHIMNDMIDRFVRVANKMNAECAQAVAESPLQIDCGRQRSRALNRVRELYIPEGNHGE